MSKGIAHGSADGPRYIYGKENVNWAGPKRAAKGNTSSDGVYDEISSDHHNASVQEVVEDIDIHSHKDNLKIVQAKDKTYLNVLDHKGNRVDRVNLNQFASLSEDAYEAKMDQLQDYLSYHDAQTTVDEHAAKQDQKFIKDFKKTRDASQHPSRGFNRVVDSDSDYTHDRNLATSDAAYQIFDHHIGDTVRDTIGLTDRELYAAVFNVCAAAKQDTAFPIRDNVEVKDGKAFYKTDGITLDGFVKASFWTAPQSAYGGSITAEPGTSLHTEQMKRVRQEILDGDVYDKANYIKNYGEAIVEKSNQVMVNDTWRKQKEATGGLTTLQAAQQVHRADNPDDYRRGVVALQETYGQQGLNYDDDPYGAEAFKQIVNNPNMSAQTMDYIVDNKMFARYDGWTDDHYDAILNSPHTSHATREKVQHWRKEYAPHDELTKKLVAEDVHAQRVIKDNPQLKDSLARVQETHPRGVNSSERTMKFDPQVVNAVGEGYVMRNYVHLHGASYNPETGEVRGYIN